MARFFGQDTYFFDLFERSAAKVVQGAEMIAGLLDDFENVPLKAKQIKDVEHEADQITHETLERLHRTFVTPLDREDIHDLVCALDDILDQVDTAAEKLNLYRVRRLRADVRPLAEILVGATREVHRAVRALRRLRDTETVISHCIEINRLENEGDIASRTAVARLFDQEQNPLEVIKWKEVYESLEEAVDRCEDVANVLQGIALKNA